MNLSPAHLQGPPTRPGDTRSREFLPWVISGVLGRELSGILVVLSFWGASASAQDNCTGDPITGFQCPVGLGGGGDVQTGIGQAVSTTPDTYFDRRRRSQQEQVPSGSGSGAEGALLGVFASAFGFSESIEQRRTLGADSDAYGGIVGVDYGGDKAHAGVGLYYQRMNVNLDNDTGRTNIDQFGVEIFGNMSPAPGFFLAGAAAISRDQYDTRRNIISTEFEEVKTSASGDTEGITFSVAGGGGYGHRLLNDLSISLSHWIDYRMVNVEAYRESGAVAVDEPAELADITPNLLYDSDDFNRLRSIIELNVSTFIEQKVADFQPTLSFLYFHEWMSDPRTVRARLIDTGGEISYQTNELDENYFGLVGALTVWMPQGWLGQISFDVIFGHSYWDRKGISLGLSRYF